MLTEHVEIKPSVRRLAILPVTVDLLAQMGSTMHLVRVCSNPLPVDAHVVGAQFDQTIGQVQLLIESERFREVAEGAPVPQMDGPAWRAYSLPALRYELTAALEAIAEGDKTRALDACVGLRAIVEELQQAESMARVGSSGLLAEGVRSKGGRAIAEALDQSLDALGFERCAMTDEHGSTYAGRGCGDILGFRRIEVACSEQYAFSRGSLLVRIVRFGLEYRVWARVVRVPWDGLGDQRETTAKLFGLMAEDAGFHECVENGAIPEVVEDISVSWPAGVPTRTDEQSAALVQQLDRGAAMPWRKQVAEAFTRLETTAAREAARRKACAGVVLSLALAGPTWDRRGVSRWMRAVEDGPLQELGVRAVIVDWVALDLRINDVVHLHVMLGTKPPDDSANTEDVCRRMRLMIPSKALPSMFDAVPNGVVMVAFADSLCRLLGDPETYGPEGSPVTRVVRWEEVAARPAEQTALDDVATDDDGLYLKGEKTVVEIGQEQQPSVEARAAQWAVHKFHQECVAAASEADRAGLKQILDGDALDFAHALAASVRASLGADLSIPVVKRTGLDGRLRHAALRFHRGEDAGHRYLVARVPSPTLRGEERPDVSRTFWEGPYRGEMVRMTEGTGYYFQAVGGNRILMDDVRGPDISFDGEARFHEALAERLKSSMSEEPESPAVELTEAERKAVEQLDSGKFW